MFLNGNRVAFAGELGVVGRPMDIGEGVPDAVRVRGNRGDLAALTAGRMERGAQRQGVVARDAY